MENESPLNISGNYKNSQLSGIWIGVWLIKCLSQMNKGWIRVLSETARPILVFTWFCIKTVLFETSFHKNSDGADVKRETKRENFIEFYLVQLSALTARKYDITIQLISSISSFHDHLQSRKIWVLKTRKKVKTKVNCTVLTKGYGNVLFQL